MSTLHPPPSCCHEAEGCQWDRQCLWRNV